MATAKDYQEIYKEFVKGPPKGCRKLGSTKKKPEPLIFKEDKSPHPKTILVDCRGFEGRKIFLAETGEMYWDEGHPSASDGVYELSQERDPSEIERVTVEDYGFVIGDLNQVQQFGPVGGNTRVRASKS